MILPDIIAIHRPAEGRVVLTLSLPAGSAVFEGHFPGHPVLPGVAQLDWAIRLADQYLGLGLRVACDFQVKFRRVIPPESPVTLSLHFDAARRRLGLEYRVGDEIASTGRVALGGMP
jgi:3-hydroxymyristoyl/3-hydroxydecanoyl-(acyl carrier protein) dehydratase